MVPKAVKNSEVTSPNPNLGQSGSRFQQAPYQSNSGRSGYNSDESSGVLQAMTPYMAHMQSRINHVEGQLNQIDPHLLSSEQLLQQHARKKSNNKGKKSTSKKSNFDYGPNQNAKRII